MSVSGARDPATLNSRATRIFRRDQPEVSHQLLGVLKPRQVADLRDQGCRDNQANTAKGLQTANQRCEPPAIDRFDERRLEACSSCLRLQDTTLGLLESQLLMREIETLLRQPAPVGFGPCLLISAES